jgi:hypothetical protein
MENRSPTAASAIFSLGECPRISAAHSFFFVRRSASIDRLQMLLLRFTVLKLSSFALTWRREKRTTGHQHNAAENDEVLHKLFAERYR